MSGAIKNRVLLIVGALLAAAAATVIILLVSPGGKPDASSSSTTEMVKIELRGKPQAKIRMNGKPIGTTPKAVIVKRGTTPVELEATFTIEKLGVAKPAKKTEIWVQRRSIVPDAEQSVDFTLQDATKTSESVGPP